MIESMEIFQEKLEGQRESTHFSIKRCILGDLDAKFKDNRVLNKSESQRKISKMDHYIDQSFLCLLDQSSCKHCGKRPVSS